MLSTDKEAFEYIFETFGREFVFNMMQAVASFGADGAASEIRMQSESPPCQIEAATRQAMRHIEKKLPEWRKVGEFTLPDGEAVNLEFQEKKVDQPKPKPARVYLTKAELNTETGQQLLELSLRITEDGKVDLDEIKELRRWLKVNQHQDKIAAVTYLHDIMTRITADGHIDRDELVELHLAIERVIPAAYRKPAEQARKNREKARKERKRAQKDAEKQAQRDVRELEWHAQMRLRHGFAKVTGVTFPNSDGSERQRIIAKCNVGEWLTFQHDPDNQYSDIAMNIMRTTGEMIGHTPEYIAERIVDETEDGYQVFGLVVDVTGGTWTKPTRGVNFAMIFYATDVTNDELHAYAQKILAER